jgi:predicted transcriptional regulator
VGNGKFVFDVHSDELGSTQLNVDNVLKVLNKEGVIAPSSESSLVVQFCPN